MVARECKGKLGVEGLSIEFLEGVAKRIKLLAHPYRLKIIEILEGEQNGVPVHLIVDKIGLAQAAVSQHLNSMQRMGIVQCVRHGKEVWYTIADYSALKILNCIRCRREEL